MFVEIERIQIEKGHSHAGTRTRVGEVKTRYPNRLDYMGLRVVSFLSYMKGVNRGLGLDRI